MLRRTPLPRRRDRADCRRRPTSRTIVAFCDRRADQHLNLLLAGGVHIAGRVFHALRHLDVVARKRGVSFFQFASGWSSSM